MELLIIFFIGYFIGLVAGFLFACRNEGQGLVKKIRDKWPQIKDADF